MAANLAVGSKPPFFKLARDGGRHISSSKDASSFLISERHLRKINHNRLELARIQAN